MENNLSILFYLRKSKAKGKSEAPVYMRITLNGNRVDMATHQFALAEKWDSKHGYVKGSKEETRITNTALENLRSKVLKIYNQLEGGGKPVSAEVIRNTLTGKSKNRHALVEVFKLFNNQLEAKVGHGYSYGTLEKYQATCQKVEKYIRDQYNRSDLFLDELDFQFITNYELYLKSQLNNKHNTTSKSVSFLKRIIRYSMHNGWLDKDPFLSFRCPYKDPDRDFLSQDELETLQGKTLVVNRLAIVRDMYVFSCYTGLPFSDIEKLTPDDITTGIDGERWIIYNRVKTGNRAPIPLLSIPLSIIAKYKDYPVNVNKGRLLPVYSNQKINGYLKEVAAVCGINKNLTFHTARHTFATTVTLTNGVPIETVSKMLGHTSIKTTQIYSKVVDTKISQDMKVLKEKLSAQKPENQGKVVNL
ncbi:MAG: site-specific integrase [Bacteroidales bacterium]|nr:site-specific integrase [Bacteroidales bacterium]